MKKLHNIYLMILVVFMAACTQDPLKDITEGTNWQKERNIVSILIEGQIGTAVIERENDKAEIKIYAKTENIADISKVQIKAIELAYGASTTNKSGTTLDFTSGTTNITVTSGANTTLDWKVSLLPFKSDLEGVWYIGDIRMYCDMFTWETWGWEKNESIFGYLPELSPEWDNTITFTVEGADEKGNPFGSYQHSAGNDDVFGNFGDTAKGWDFNERFRKIPKNGGTWLRDFERNKVIITDENNIKHELDLEVLTETNEVSLKATIPYLADLFSWTDTDYAYEELAHMSNPMWYTLTKNRVLQTGNSITGFTVKDQDGNTTIDVDNKEITVVISDSGANLAAIEVTDLAISYGATATINTGDTLDFSSENKTTITVTSETNEAVIWTVKIVVKNNLEGSYSNPKSTIYVNQEFGSDYSKNISDDFTNAALEFDNTISITSTGYNGDRPNGTITNNAGTDGLYANYDHVDTDVDLNAKLRHLLPTGESYWEMDASTNTLYIGTSKDNITSQAKIISTDTGMVLAFDLTYKENEPKWNYGNYDNYMCWSYKFEITLDKQ